MKMNLLAFKNNPEMDHKNERLFTEFPPVSTAEWEARILDDLKGADYEKKLIWKTNEGFDVKPYYREGDIKDLGIPDVLPGQYPYLRGADPLRKTWEIRQEMESNVPKDANFQAQLALKKGSSGIGFSTSKIKTVNHIEVLLKGICFGECSLHFSEAKSYIDLLNLLAEFIRKHHLKKKVIIGSFNCDPVSYLLFEGDFSKSEEDDLSQIVELLQAGKEFLPSFRMITVNGQYFRNAGSTLIQELAFSLASGNEYLHLATDAGIKVDDAATRMEFSFAAGSNYFFEIAKLRAARMLWAKIVEQYKPVSEESLRMYIHSSTSNYNKTLYDPYVNILRTTTEAMSAILGGTQSLTITPFDAFYKETDDFSNRIARNQQIILKAEAYLENVADPGAGSYYIESLTDSIANAAWSLFRTVEEKGGLIEAVKQGFIQDEINLQAARMQQDVATRKVVVLGTNQFPNLQEEMLEKIQEGTTEPELPETEKPVRYKKLVIHRASDDFEELRLLTELHVEQGHKKPSVFLLTMGNLAMRKARAMFSTNFFGCAGFQVIDNPGFNTVDEGVREALRSDASVVVICSSDEEYAEIAPEIARKIKAKNKEIQVMVAGHPKEILDTLKNAGVDDFIHIRTHVLEFLRNLQKKLGITI
jgi:methylmalonyl-CoA mutase